ncbi:transferase [Bordetella ansorpii]|uniref:Transferase n=1 Tax=Bordetella ansorpii TaxID=288768 RepID=A0A157RI01_9BORD|nr:gamma carbonic anhydrase family protein [Bordetella ansorpii]SAI57555.1 transferase [Bordetella ansorpii]
MTIYALKGVSPQLPPPGEYWVAPNATVIGNVSLAREASLWFGVSARADHEPIAIGEGSNVQENAVLHVDPGFPIQVGKHCTIGHNAILHGCTVDDGVIVGMGAIVMNGAHIGAGSIVAAGAVVTEGKAFPPHSLIVGAPAKVMRTLEPEAAARLTLAAVKYVANWKSMTQDLVALD